MAAVQQALLMAGASASVYWNAADKHADIVLSDSGKLARNTAILGALRGVRGIVGKTTGTHDFELATEATYASGDSTEVYAGVATAAVSLAGQPIFGSLGGQYASFRGNSQWGSDTGGGGTYSGSGWAAANGVCVVRLRVNADAHTVDIYDAGGHRGQMTYSDPVGAPVYPWVQMADLSGTGVRLRLLAGEFTLSVAGSIPAWGTA